MWRAGLTEQRGNEWGKRPLISVWQVVFKAINWRCFSLIKHKHELIRCRKSENHSKLEPGSSGSLRGTRQVINIKKTKKQDQHTHWQRNGRREGTRAHFDPVISPFHRHISPKISRGSSTGAGIWWLTGPETWLPSFSFLFHWPTSPFMFMFIPSLRRQRSIMGIVQP